MSVPTDEAAAVGAAVGAAVVAPVVARSRDAAAVWSRVDVRDRAAAVLRLHDLVRRDHGRLADLVQQATGKTPRDAFLEVAAVLPVLRYYGCLGPALLRPRTRRVRGIFAPGLVSGVERRVPVGVVANIAAWNYPLVFALADTVPAVLAGNAVIIKPDPRSDDVVRAVVALASAAGLPEGLVTAVHGGSAELGEAVVDAVDHVLFTGSARVGRLVAERAGRALTSVTLELGGKNAAYVAADADLDAAAEAMVRDCFGAAGQTCTATERLYVHTDVVDRFTELFTRRTGQIRLGADHDSDMGPLTTPEHLAGVAAHVREAVAAGARVVAGGRARPDLGPAFYEPTILADVPPQARVAADETFGPVVSIWAVADDAAAVSAINSAPPALMAAVWTRDLARGRRVAAAVRAGTVMVNETYHLAWASPGLPLGGVGQSGLGRRYGADGLREVTRAHVTIVSRGGVARRFAALSEARSRAALVAVAGLMRALRWP